MPNFEITITREQVYVVEAETADAALLLIEGGHVHPVSDDIIDRDCDEFDNGDDEDADVPEETLAYGGDPVLPVVAPAFKMVGRPELGAK